MVSSWLEILDETIDANVIERRVQENLAIDKRSAAPETMENPEALIRIVWQEVIGEIRTTVVSGQEILVQQRDCDIVPRRYLIKWRRPILGPINAAIRRLINAEVRRYLLPSLEKQSFINRQLLQVVKDLAEENAQLRLEIEKMRQKQE